VNGRVKQRCPTLTATAQRARTFPASGSGTQDDAATITWWPGEQRLYYLYLHLSRYFDVTLLAPNMSHLPTEVIVRASTGRIEN